MMGSGLLRLERVYHHYDQGKIVAIWDVTLDVHRGEWLTIIGPSGSGKTTLLNLMCGLDLPSQGRVFFQEQQPHSNAEWTDLRARQVGFVFQAFNLLPTLTAIENVQIPMFGVCKSAAIRSQRALELLRQVDLEQRAHHLPGHLSGGERQRVAIARSLANSPSLILADEPTGNLDTQSAGQIMDLLSRIHTQDGTTIVMVTHNPVVAQRGDRWIKLIDGRISADGQSRAVDTCIS
jgi:ABC-type lipoprotein export system ATPase subunit